jgi:fibronectin-binding autotransporter adhesin
VTKKNQSYTHGLLSVFEYLALFCQFYLANVMNVKRFLLVAGLILISIFGFEMKALAATPILEYRFNETGTTVVGSCPTNPITLSNANGTIADLHSADGTGVSNLPGDRAFDNTASSQMGKGNNNTGGIANQGDLAAIDKLASLTLQGWFKTAPGTTIGGFARLFDNHDDKITPQGGYEFWGGSRSSFTSGTPTDPGKLTLLLDDGEVSTTTAAYQDQDTWVFFAVSYDGTLITNNVKFFKGTKASPVALVDTLTLNKGTVNEDQIGLGLGNRLRPSSFRDRPLDGFLDNMRIFGTPIGKGGVLSQSELEALRIRDISNLP